MTAARATQAAPRTLLGSRLGYWLLAAALLSSLAPRSALGACLLLLNGVIVLLYLWDRARLLRASLDVRRDGSQRLRASVRTPYQLLLSSRRAPNLRVRLAEQPCPGFLIEPVEHSTLLPADEPIALHGHVLAPLHARGTLQGVIVRKETLLGLCAHQEAIRCETTLRAYPDLPLGRGPLLTMERRDLGDSPQRMLSGGQGSELASLREYVATDSMRNIDWKASARRNRPITRSYRPERSQTLWIVLDASRVMTLPVDGGGRLRFVAALEAALELADTALESGDRVGLLVFAREPLLCVMPGRGRAHLLHMVEQLLGVHARPCELAADELVRCLARLAPKRSLVLLFSDLDNEGDLQALARHAHVLSRHHLTLCFSLHSAPLQELAARPSETDAQVYQKLAAQTLLQQRARLAKVLGQHGMPVLEVSARGLARAALGRYRQIKLSGRL